MTTLLVLAALGLRVSIVEGTGRFGFIYFVLPIVASALLFNHGTGFYAVALSAALTAAIVPWGPEALPGNISAIAVFAIVGICLVFVAEGLHSALIRAHAAQRTTDLLLQEMSHRVKNKFAMISSIIALQARTSDPQTRRALEDVGARVNIIATVHNYLQVSRHDGLIDTQEYLVGLGNALREALCGHRPITIGVASIKAQLPPEKALALGLIVNELVTNAFKYAFENEHPGHIQIGLTVDENRLVLIVSDNGKGCGPDVQPGLGSRLVTVFAAQLGGSVEWDRARSDGCCITVRVPIEPSMLIRQTDESASRGDPSSAL